MYLFRRCATSLSASLETLVNQLENHEALVARAISEMEAAEARLRVQLGRVNRDGEALRKRLSELEQAIERWTERALAVSPDDKARGLECLRRKKQAERESETVREQLAAHKRLESQLNTDLKEVSGRIAELRRKKNILSAKEYRMRALKIGELANIGRISEVDEIIDRWEMAVGAYDVTPVERDEFEEQFTEQENTRELEAELAQLVHGRELEKK